MDTFLIRANIKHLKQQLIDGADGSLEVALKRQLEIEEKALRAYNLA